MKIIDISRKLYPGAPVWPGDCGLEIRKDASIERGDVCNLTSVTMSLHTGTHVDAPFHFVRCGKTLHELDLSRFIGKVRVLAVDVRDCIRKEDVVSFPIEPGDAVFFKTINSSFQDAHFHTDFVYIHSSAADYLVERGVRTVGVDYFSIDGFGQEGHRAHTILLEAEVGVIEGLDLSAADPGEYFFSCLPVCVQDADGAPARAVLIRWEEVHIGRDKGTGW